MSPPHDPNGCQALECLLEAFVDGELDKSAAASLEEHLDACPSCTQQVRLALEICRELRDLPELDAPQQVLEAALIPARQRQPNSWSWRQPWRLPRPAWIALGGAAAAILLATVMLNPRPESTSPRRSVEIERATAEARLALAYLEKVTQRTARSLRDDVVQKRVVEPTLRSLARSLKASETDSRESGPVSDHRSSDNMTRSS